MDFFCVDIENDELPNIGKFDLVLSLGNVISHISKKAIPSVLLKIRSCLEINGTFVFDALAIEDSFAEEVYEKDLGIVWNRKLNRQTGEISLKGIFQNFNFTQEFKVWGYAEPEMVRMLKESGFSRIESSTWLDFSSSEKLDSNPICLKYRAQI